MDRSDVGDLLATCRALRLVLPPGTVFSHLTSAAIRGWRLPVVARVPIVATTSDDAPHHDRRGVYVRRCDLPDRHRREVHDVPVASVEWTIVELAEDLSLIDLVAVIDGVLHTGESTVDRLWGAVVPGRRGVKVLRAALALVDGRSESWWESVLRMAHHLADIPVDVQVVVRDAQDRFVARTDLHILGTMRHPEYDGGEHRRAERHRADLRREKGLSRLGRERYGYTSEEIVRDPTRVVRDAEDALGRPHDPARWKTWVAELQRSSVTTAGWARLDRRLRRLDRAAPPRTARRLAQ
jgi:very-short-patch-repair endonuclease